MKTYLVGGAVRDQLLGRPVTERDWVVVGSTPNEMLAQGFRPIGKAFPVFLHPETHEEYALARTERKVGPGYTGFTFHASPHVTLEQDLKRRDLTINAIAQAKDGTLIDPYEGQKDLRQKILRHVSLAFIEDPVRILRTARFAARYHHLGFRLAFETAQLMKDIVAQGEIKALVVERVWQEFLRALSEMHPGIFFEVLNECGALIQLFPEIASGSPSLDFKIYPDLELTFAHLMLQLKENDIKTFCARYPVPKSFTELSFLGKRQQSRFLQLEALTAEDICALLYEVDAWRRQQRFQQLLTLFQSSKHRKIIEKSYIATQSIVVATLLKHGLQGNALKEAIYEERLKKIKLILP